MLHLFLVWAGNDASEDISAEAERTEEKEEAMARRKLSLADQLRGVHAALRSKKTPPQFLDGLRNRKAELEKKLKESSASTPKRRFRSSRLGVFGL